MLRTFLVALCLCCPVVSGADAAGEGTLGGVAAEYRVRRGDTLHDIARRFGLGFIELRAANPRVDAWLPPPGTVLDLPTRHILPVAPRKGIVINLAERRLYFFRPDGGAPLSFPIGIGQSGWRTPLGTFRVIGKRVRPTWTVPASIRAESPWLPPRVPPGPENPLGDYALDLSRQGYLIHGTNMPDGVGRRVSHGCIRLYPEHIAALFPAVAPGTPVHIVDQPTKLAWSAGELFLEVHPTPSEADGIERGIWPRGLAAGANDVLARARRAAADGARRLDTARVIDVLKARRGIPKRITAPFEEDGPARAAETGRNLGMFP